MKVTDLLSILMNSEIPAYATIEAQDGSSIDWVCVSRDQNRLSLGTQDEQTPTENLAEGWKYIEARKS